LACLTVDLELQHAASALCTPKQFDLVRFSLQANPTPARDVRSDIAWPSGWQNLSQKIAGWEHIRKIAFTHGMA
jgi:hypothetical protein